MYTLEPLNSKNANLWDEILTQCPDSSAFHATAWRNALADSFKQLTHAYFFIKENDTIIGGLPAFVFQPIPQIKMLHSMPWNLFGGIQLMRATSVDTSTLMQSVEAELDRFVTEQRLCETILTLSPNQTQQYGDPLIAAGYQQHDELFTHLLKTESDYNLLWNAYNKRVRGAVRKAEKTGCDRLRYEQ